MTSAGLRVAGIDWLYMPVFCFAFGLADHFSHLTRKHAQTVEHIWLIGCSNIWRWPAFTQNPYLSVFLCLSTTIITISYVPFLSLPWWGWRLFAANGNEDRWTWSWQVDEDVHVFKCQYLSRSHKHDSSNIPEAAKLQLNCCFGSVFAILATVERPLQFQYVYHCHTKISYIELMSQDLRILPVKTQVEPSLQLFGSSSLSVSIDIHWKVKAIQSNFLRYFDLKCKKKPKPKQNRLELIKDLRGILHD